MTQFLSRIVYWLSSLYLLLMPVIAIWWLLQIETFQYLMQGWTTGIQIDWESVSGAQMYAYWALTIAKLALFYFMMLFVQRSFRRFARGEWFDESSSRNLRTAASLLLVNVIASPLYYTLSVTLLTMHEPPGERTFFMAVSTMELRSLASGLVLWVLADLLLKGMRAENENRQFV